MVTTLFVLFGCPLLHAKPAPPQLSEEDRQFLENDSVLRGNPSVSDLLGVYLGFGLGHAAQHRWQNRGWIFTVGEATTLAVAFTNLFDCSSGGSQHSSNSAHCRRAALWGVGFVGFKIWEIVDLSIYSSRYRERIEELKKRGDLSASLSAAITPAPDGALLGLNYRW